MGQYPMAASLCSIPKRLTRRQQGLSALVIDHGQFPGNNPKHCPDCNGLVDGANILKTGPV